MDFTTTEKRMIVRGLEDTYGYLGERMNAAIQAAKIGVRYEGEVLEAITDCYNQYEAFLIIENKIFSSLEDEPSQEKMLHENQQCLDSLRSFKETLGISEDDREPETVND